MLDYRIRPYALGDRAGVRHVCCETGCQGQPVDRLFADRDAFADFFTRYYTDWEPANALVVESGGQVGGYLLAALNPARYAAVQAWLVGGLILPKVLLRLAAGRYRRDSLRFLAWFAARAGRETPRVPPRSAHFHFNLLPALRNGAVIRDLALPFLESLPARGVRRLYGQMQTFSARRREALFLRFGFREYDRRRVTRFAHLGVGEEVHVSTLYREFR